MLKILKHYYHEEHEDGGKKTLLPFPFVTFVANISFSSFNVPRNSGVGDYLRIQNLEGVYSK
jgi:hypothetical protein